jgi:hypothetical protein
VGLEGRDGVEGAVKLEREGKKCMIDKGDGGDREVANKRDQVLASEDIINYTRTATMWPIGEEVRVWETWETI